MCACVYIGMYILILHMWYTFSSEDELEDLKQVYVESEGVYVCVGMSVSECMC